MDDEASRPTAPQGNERQAQPLLFFAWVLALSVPFYVWGIFWPIAGLLPAGLPVSATMIVVPAFVATVMTFREKGRRGVADLWRQIFDVRQAKGEWALVTYLFWPVAMLVSYGLLLWIGVARPSHLTAGGVMVTSPLLFAEFFLGAVPEEVGWTAYATVPLQARYGVFRAGLIIGAVWAAWHIIPYWYLSPDRTIWVFVHALTMVVARIVMGWIYAFGGRSVFLAIGFHAMSNVTWVLFPNRGSHRDLSVSLPVLTILAVLMAISPLITRRNAAMRRD